MYLFTPAGGTDPSISDDVLSANGVTPDNCSEYESKIQEAFRIMPDIVKKGIDEEK